MNVRLAIFFSGNGTNLEELIKKLHKKQIRKHYYEILLCLSNKSEAKGINKALKHSLQTVVVKHGDFNTREDFDKALVEKLKEKRVHLCVLAGFMRVLTPVFTKQVKAVNLHPSLLPSFKGTNAIQRSFEAGARGGVSVHWVSEDLDAGELICQESFENKGLSFKEFEAKVHTLEYEVFAKGVVKACESLFKD